jgi:hypothetical protein
MTRTFALPSLVACLLASLVPAVAHAAETPMAPVECTNLTLGECTAVEAVFADAYAVASGQLVARAVPPPAVVQGSGPAPGEAAPAPPLPPAPATLPAGETLRVSAVRLTSRIALRSWLSRADGSPIHSVEMTASSLDDVQPAADRMTRALVARTSVGQTMTLKNITRTEGQRPNRTFTEKVMGLKTSLIMPFASDIDLAPMLAVQFDGRFEADSYFLEFGAGITMPTNESGRRGYGGLFAEFGGSLYLGEEGSPLYVGAGLMPRLFFTSDNGGVQAAVYGQVGVMFMRTSSTRLYAELRLAQNALPVTFDNELEPSVPPSTYPRTYSQRQSKYPTEIGLQMGIGW